MIGFIKRLIHYSLGRHKIKSREQLIAAIDRTREKQAADIFNNSF